MSKAKKKGLFAFLLALLASAIVSGTLLLSPATVNAAAGAETAEDGTVTISGVSNGNELFSAVREGGTAGQPLVIRFAENTNMEFTAGDNGNLYYQDESGQMQHLSAGNFVIYDEFTTASSITLDLNGGSITLDTKSVKALDVRGVELTIMNGEIVGTASENLATSDSDITLENVDITFNYTPDTTPAGGAAVVTTENLTLADVNFTLNGTGAKQYEATEVKQYSAKAGGAYYETLSAAVSAAKEGETVTLLADVTEDITVAEGADLTLDLAGNTLTSVNSHAIANSGTLTVTGEGSVVAATQSKAAVYNEGTFAAESGTFTRTADTGWYVIANRGAMTLEGVVVETANDTNDSSLIVNQADTNASLTIKSGTYTGGKLTLNTVKIETGTSLTITGGTFTNIDQHAVLNYGVAQISGGTFTANAGSAVYTDNQGLGGDYGKLTITGGTFTGKAAIEAARGAQAAISGSETVVTGPTAVRSNGAASKIVITEGTFSGAIASKGSGPLEVSGGSFDTYNSRLADSLVEGMLLTSGADGVYTLITTEQALENGAVAAREKLPYDTLQGAINDAGYNNEIMLLKDVQEDITIAKGKKFTLDLNSFKITNKGDHTITNYGTLTIKGEGVVDNVTHARGALFNLGTATLLGGDYTRSKEDSKTNSWYAIKNLGHLTIGAEGEECSVQVIQDGNFSSLITNGYYDADGKAGGDYDTYSGLVTTDDKLPTLTINGGTFRGGINTVKNDNHSVATINGGEFVNTTQATVLNWNELTINGGTFNADSNALYAVITSYDGSTGYNNGITNIAGGTFNGGLLADVNAAEVTYEISGGTFDTAVPEDFLAEDFVLNYNAEDGTFAPVEKIAFAHVERGGKIYSFAQPDQAIAFAEEGETVVLDVSFKIPGSLVINKSINLDLNGQTITGTVSGKATLQINGLEEGKSFDVNIFSSVEGAKIVSEKSLALWALHDANVTVTGITVEGFGTAIQVGIANSARTASLTVNDCEVIATSEDINDVPAGIFVVGNVTKANAEDYGTLQPVTLIVNDSHITGYAYGVVGNGLNHNTYIELNNTDIDGYMADGGMSIYSTGIFHPQNGTMIVNGGSITAENTAIEIRSGNLTIKGDAVLTATSKEFGVQSAADGTTVMGVALGISQHTTNLDINVNIESGTFTGVKAVYEEDLMDDQSSNISVNITGGQFNGAVESKDVKGFITGGRFAELPAEDAFAEGLAGELYDGYYMVVNAEDVNAAASIADRLSAQSDLRAYLASFGLTITDMQLVAESDELAADIVAAYDEIFAASTKEGVAEALAAAMDAVDAYKLGLDIEKAAALTELIEYSMGAQGGDLAIVVVPTYAISAINAAVTADEIETYVSLAKAEMDDIRAQRAEAEQQYQAVNDRFDAIMQALGITGSAEEGYTSEVLDKLNGVIEALGITESDGAWSTDLLDGITRDLETANENIAAMQDLLGTAADEATAQTIIGMIKATQNSVAAAETNIKNAISTLSSDIQTKYDALVQAVGELPTDVAGALDGRLSELEGTVSGLDTTVGNLGTDIGELETAVAGLTTAQQQLTQAINGYKTAVDGILTDMSGKFEEISAKLDNLPTGDELATALTNALSGVTEQLTAIKAEVDKIDGMDDTIIGSVSDKIDAAFASFTQTFNTAMSGINTKLDDLGSAVAALPDDADITALKTAIAAAQTAAETAGNKVDTLGTTLGGRLDSVDTTLEGIDGTIAGLTTAQNALAQAINGYKTAVNSALAGIEQNIAGVKADIKNLADTAAADKLELLEKLNALQTSADAIEQAIASLDGDSSADLSAISAELAALQTSLGDVADVVDEVALGNTNSSSSFAGIYVYLSAILVLAAVILIVLAVKKRR